jgi:hypothetical protein
VSVVALQQSYDVALIRLVLVELTSHLSIQCSPLSTGRPRGSTWWWIFLFHTHTPCAGVSSVILKRAVFLFHAALWVATLPPGSARVSGRAGAPAGGRRAQPRRLTSCLRAAPLTTPVSPFSVASQSLSALTRLETLTFSASRELSDAGVAHLRKLRRLRSLTSLLEVSTYKPALPPRTVGTFHKAAPLGVSKAAVLTLPRYLPLLVRWDCTPWQSEVIQALRAAIEARIAGRAPEMDTLSSEALLSPPASSPRVGNLEAAFVASAAWDGPRVGYTFKTGDRGLGYYKDAQLGATLVRLGEREGFMTDEQKKALEQLLEQLAEPCADERSRLVRDIMAADRYLASAEAQESRKPELEGMRDGWLEQLKKFGGEDDEDDEHNEHDQADENDENDNEDHEDDQAAAEEDARATAVLPRVSEEAAQLAATNAIIHRRRAEHDEDLMRWNDMRETVHARFLATTSCEHRKQAIKDLEQLGVRSPASRATQAARARLLDAFCVTRCRHCLR